MLELTNRFGSVAHALPHFATRLLVTVVAKWLFRYRKVVISWPDAARIAFDCLKSLSCREQNAVGVLGWQLLWVCSLTFIVLIIIIHVEISRKMNSFLKTDLNCMHKRHSLSHFPICIANCTRNGFWQLRRSFTGRIQNFTHSSLFWTRHDTIVRSVNRQMQAKWCKKTVLD